MASRLTGLGRKGTALPGVALASSPMGVRKARNGRTSWVLRSIIFLGSKAPKDQAVTSSTPCIPKRATLNVVHVVSLYIQPGPSSGVVVGGLASIKSCIQKNMAVMLE